MSSTESARTTGQEDTGEDSWPAVTHTVHIVIGVFLGVSGISGTFSNMSLLTIHLRLREKLMDPTGVLLFNFLVANLCMSLLQFPFSGSSSFAGSWLYGDFGCQAYAAIGFFFGIGVIFSLGLIILDGYLLTLGSLGPNPRTRSHSLILIACTWLLVLVFVIPPLLDIFGRYGLEPGGTSCTIDYWHGNYRNYNNFVIFLMIFAYILPISAMLFMFLRSVTQIQTKEATLRWSLIFTEHEAAMTKVCGLLFIVQIACWTPYAILVLWTIILPPDSLNIYYTLLPSVCCKLAPVINAMIVWWNIPRVAAAYFYLKHGGRGPEPQELFDYIVEMDQEPGQEEKESLTPGVG